MELVNKIEDPRQYVPVGGQVWSSLAREKGKHKNSFEQDKYDERIWSITTEPKVGQTSHIIHAFGF